MAYKTILVHVDESGHLRSRVNLAARIAVAENAHLIGAAMTGISRYLLEGLSSPLDPAMQPYLDALNDRADRGLDAFEEMVKRAGVTSYEKRVIDNKGLEGFSLHARYSDLLVIGQEDPDEPSPAVMPGFPEYITMSGGSPTLIVPYASSYDNVATRVLIGWNASSNAMHAVHGALPFLRKAKSVDVVVFNAASRQTVFGEEPGADIALHLARHDVRVNVMQEELGNEIDVGNALLSIAAERGIDLLVMGCYGHSRFRELLLGGATHVVLESMTVPVLMAY